MKLPIYVVDAFGRNAPFSGNPAAVCPLSEPITDEMLLQNIASQLNLSDTAFLSPLCTDADFKLAMKKNEMYQKIAMQMNLSETSFVYPTENHPGNDLKNCKRFKLRWFTPTAEVPLCGHATLATAKVLFDVYGNVNKEVEFETIYSGVLKAQSIDGNIWISLPLNVTNKELPDEWDYFNDVFPLNTDVYEYAYNEKLKLPLLRVADEYTVEQFRELKLDMVALGKKVDWFILTMRAPKNCCDANKKPFDFLSRFFAPGYGIEEDPVTGAAHSVLSSYWSEELHKTSMYAWQCSERGGHIHIEVDHENQRARLGGQGIVALEGTLIV